MPKRRRNAPRCRSTHARPPIDAGGVGDTAPHCEPILEPCLSIHQSSHNQSNEREQLDPLIEADSNNMPESSHRGRKSNKYWTVNMIDANGGTKKTRIRAHDLFRLPPRQKIVLEWNREGQPIGEAGGLLGQFLGQVASDFNNFPISYEKWTLVPSTYKDHVWDQVIKEKFVLNDDQNKKYILGSLGKKWRDNRVNLFNVYYDQSADWETNIKNNPESISRYHWAGFLSYRLRQSTKDMCKKNAENRYKQKVPQTLGSKTIARKKHEMELELGRTCDRAELWNMAHKKRMDRMSMKTLKRKVKSLVHLHKHVPKMRPSQKSLAKSTRGEFEPWGIVFVPLSS